MVDAGSSGSLTEHEEALDELSALRMLVSNSTDLLGRYTADGVCTYASPACRELLGYEPEEMLGRSAYDFFHPDDLAEITATHTEILDEPDVSTVVYRIRHKLGHYVWFETTSHTVRDAATGEVIEIQTSSRDVTRRVDAETQLRRSEEQFRLAMTSAPIGMALVGLDGTFLEVNDQLARVVGRTPAELLALTFQDITHPDDLEADLAYVRQLLDGSIDQYSMQKRYFHSDGSTIWILLSGSLVRDTNGDPVHFVAQIQDITQQIQQQEQLRRSEEQFRLAMTNAPIGMTLVGLDGAFIEVNDQLARVVGRTPAELLALTFQDITHPDDLEADLAYLQQLLDGSIDQYSMQKRYFHADGRTIWVLLSVCLVRDSNGDPVHFVSQIQDITQRIHDQERLEAASQELERLANEDELTGLASRRAVLQRLESELQRDDRHGRGVAVLLADVDHFKHINDRYGHAAGDRVLREIAETVSEAVRSIDTVGRFGGEEMLVVLPEVDESDALLIADRMLERIRTRISTPDGPVTISIGVAARHATEPAEQLIARADRALYRAKEAGRNNAQGHEVT